MNRIKELRKGKKLTQDAFCKIIGISQGALSGWENERYEPDLKSVQKIADYFDVTTDYLIGGELDKPHRKGVRIPVLGYVAGGIPIDAIEDVLDWEEIDEDMARYGDYFALKIKGDSMEPRIFDGDIVIVRQQDDVNSGDTAVVYVNGDEATCKKIKKTPEGIYLISTNPDYDPFFYSNEQIAELPVAICGKVVEIRGSL